MLDGRPYLHAINDWDDLSLRIERQELPLVLEGCGDD